MNPIYRITALSLVGFFGIIIGLVISPRTGLTPTFSNPTENWSAYSDSTNGFLIKFPLAETQRPFAGEPTTDLGKGQVSLPDAVGGKERWLEVSTLEASSLHLDNNKCLIINDEQKTTNRFFDGRRFCQSTSEEGAAGSSYRTDVFTTTVGSKYAVLKFTSRHTNDVHAYGDCEQDFDLVKPLCQNYAFDPVRDLKLLDDIVATFKTK